MSALKYLSCILLFIFSSIIYPQIPDTVWTKTFGGALADVGNSVIQTNDGGFVVAATTSSFGAGGQDIWLIKTDENGDTLWTKTFGGIGNDRTANVVQTNDNGYAIFGTTNSFGNGGDDFLLWKTDSSGNTEWFKTYGASTNEQADDGLQTIDGGYIIVGDSLGQDDHALVIKTDEFGNELWGTKIGDTDPIGHHFGNSVQQADNGEYYLAGNYVYYYFPYYNIINYFLAKLTSDGVLIYIKTYSYNNLPSSCQVVKKLDDGNLLLGGYTDMSNTRPWILKITPAGNIIWQKILSGVYLPLWLTSLEATLDNGFIITAKGSDNSIRDFHILKADEYGNLQWEELIGGMSTDEASSICLTNDIGYIVTGQTNSFGSGDFDAWLVKFKYNSPPNIQMNFYPPVDTALINGGCTIPEFTCKNLVSNDVRDSISIEPGFNTNFYYFDSSGYQIPLDNYYFIVIDSLDEYEYELWFHPKSYPPFDPALIEFDSTFYSEQNDYEIQLIVKKDGLQIDSLSQPFHADFGLGVEENGELPKVFYLYQNYPNPFNPTTKILYKIPEQVRNDIHLVTLKVYDVLGNEIATLVNEEKQPGTYEVEFDASNLSSGIYYYQLRNGSFIETKKMVFIK